MIKTRKGNLIMTEISALLPEVTLHETETHKYIINSKGEFEIVSAMGAVENLGKGIKEVKFYREYLLLKYEEGDDVLLSVDGDVIALGKEIK